MGELLISTERFYDADKVRVDIMHPNPVKCFRLTGDEAIDIANSLIEHARFCGSTKPIIVSRDTEGQA